MVTKIILGIILCLDIGMLCVCCFVLGHYHGLETAMKIVNDAFKDSDDGEE